MEGSGSSLWSHLSIFLLFVVAVSKICGEAASGIAFTFWLDAFPKGTAAQFTVVAISGIVMAVIFVPITIILAVVYKWNHPHGILGPLITARANLWLIFLLGSMDVLVDFSGAYAAPKTPIITQAFAKSAGPMMTWGLERLLLGNRSKMRSWKLWCSFLCVAISILLHLWYAIRNEPRALMFGYLMLYVLSITCSSGYNIVLGKYMRLNNIQKAPKATVGSSQPPAYLVRLLVLSGDMLVNLLLTFAVGSFIDAIPHFGNSSSVAQAWIKLLDGLHCLFWECDQKMMWYALLCYGGWTITYLTDTFLTQLSPAMSSIIAVNSAPLQALALMIVPAWSLGMAPPRTLEQWILSALALGFTIVAVVLYALHAKEHESSQSDTPAYRLLNEDRQTGPYL